MARPSAPVPLTASDYGLSHPSTDAARTGDSGSGSNEPYLNDDPRVRTPVRLVADLDNAGREPAVTIPRLSLCTDTNSPWSVSSAASLPPPSSTPSGSQPPSDRATVRPPDVDHPPQFQPRSLSGDVTATASLTHRPTTNCGRCGIVLVWLNDPLSTQLRQLHPYPSDAIGAYRYSESLRSYQVILLYSWSVLPLVGYPHNCTLDQLCQHSNSARVVCYPLLHHGEQLRPVMVSLLQARPVHEPAYYYTQWLLHCSTAANNGRVVPSSPSVPPREFAPVQTRVPPALSTGYRLINRCLAQLRESSSELEGEDTCLDGTLLGTAIELPVSPRLTGTLDPLVEEQVITLNACFLELSLAGTCSVSWTHAPVDPRRVLSVSPTPPLHSLTIAKLQAMLLYLESLRFAQTWPDEYYRRLAQAVVQELARRS